MKKIILTLCLILLAQTTFATTSVDFIYINGSNNNDDKAYESFINRTTKFHPVLKSAIEKDALTYERILKNGDYTISDKPSHYFWGYKSQEDLMAMQERAKLLQSVSPWVAYSFRNILAGMLHDAIWVRNAANMVPILDELHEQVKKDVAEGKKVILLGYSAGTFITLEYMTAKVAFVDMRSWLTKLNLPKDTVQMIKQNPRKNTCGSALLHSNMVRLTAMGNVEVNNNKEEFKKAYLNMDKLTEYYCVPEGTILGVINNASPIPLFYSDIFNPKYDTNNFAKLMYKHVIEHGMFFLTVNFADDPLGFPNSTTTSGKIGEMLNINFEKASGFVYDYSSDISWRTFIGAHTCYWNAKERFSKAIIKGFKEGFSQYDDNKNKK